VRKFAIGVVALALLAACGDDGGRAPNDETDGPTVPQSSVDSGSDNNGLGPSCSDWLSRDVKADEVEGGCVTEGNHLNTSATYECPDGRTLYWNDEGWGYVGEPMHAHEAGAEKVAPEADREACNA
jgi:hypothetical protein